MTSSNTSLTLKSIPPEVTDILLTEQGKKLIDKKIYVSKESLIYQIIKEWKKLKYAQG